MAASLLLQSNLILNPIIHPYYHISSTKPPHNFIKKSPLIYSHNIQLVKKNNPPQYPFHVSTKPTKPIPKCSSHTSKTHSIDKFTIKKNPLENFIQSLIKTLKKPAIVAVLLGLLIFYDPNAALAASGGRTGGRSFSSSSSSSSRSYSNGSSSSRIGFSGSVPYYAPSPFGFYMGPAVSFGVGASSSLVFVFMGFVAFLLVSGFISDRSEGGSVLTATEKTSVLKLQVGLLGLARSLQRDLNRIAETADTSKKEGLTYILTEASLAMLRHPDYCISGYSSVDVRSNMEDGEKRFNRLSIEERGKFDEETLVNVNNIKKQSTSSRKSTGFNNEYIVITILVAAEGVHKLPAINTSEDLKEALKKLGSIPTNKILAVEVLWTPQNEDDTLTERELLEDYPLLRPL